MPSAAHASAEHTSAGSAADSITKRRARVSRRYAQNVCATDEKKFERKSKGARRQHGRAARTVRADQRQSMRCRTPGGAVRSPHHAPLLPESLHRVLPDSLQRARQSPPRAQEETGRGTQSAPIAAAADRGVGTPRRSASVQLTWHLTFKVLSSPLQTWRLEHSLKRSTSRLLCYY